MNHNGILVKPPLRFVGEFPVKYKTFQLIPHMNIRNDRMSQFADSITDSYQELFKRIRKGGVDGPDRVFFETVMTNKRYSTYVTTNCDLVDTVKQHSQVVWKNITLKNGVDPSKKLSVEGTGYNIKLKLPFFLSLKTDQKLRVLPLNEILEISRFMRDDDLVFTQFGFQAAEEGWYKEAEDNLKNFQKKKPRYWRKKGGLSPSTEMKTCYPGFDFSYKIYVFSKDKRRERRIARGILLAIKQLNHDNELIEKQVKLKKMKKWIQDIQERKIKVPLLFGKRQLMSNYEIGHFIKLPQRQLQEEYPIIQTISEREVTIPDRIRKGGMHLGTVTYKGRKQEVYMPINNHDEVCLPKVVIGGMGSGKTKGYGANKIVEAVNNGFGALSIDPAKGEIGNEVQSVLPSEKVTRINLGKTIFSLDWCEVNHSKQSKNRLANTIISFFNTGNDETGFQTQRFIRAAVMGMKTGKLSEIMRILEDKEYRMELLCPKHGVLDQLNTMHIATLEDLNKMSDGKRAQILAPIYNRLDTILGDSYLSECMESDESIDMVKLMSQRKAIIIDVPKSELGTEAVDIVVNLLSTKIDLAMTLRKEKNQFPFFVIFDEPHQFLRSTKIWKSAAVESRKWRVGYVWMFHSWEQIPGDLAEIIKAAGPHYHIYSSSKKTFAGLREEIAPFTVEEAIKMKRFHAINVLRVGGEVVKPFMAKMTPPPSFSKKYSENVINQETTAYASSA